MSAEAQRIGQGITDFFFHRSADGVVQITLFVCLPGSHGLMY